MMSADCVPNPGFLNFVLPMVPVLSSCIPQATRKPCRTIPVYEVVVAEVLEALTTSAMEARQAGVREVIIDPGIGIRQDLGA